MCFLSADIGVCVEAVWIRSHRSNVSTAILRFSCTIGVSANGRSGQWQLCASRVSNYRICANPFGRVQSLIILRQNFARLRRPLPPLVNRLSQTASSAFSCPPTLRFLSLRAAFARVGVFSHYRAFMHVHLTLCTRLAFLSI